MKWTYHFCVLSSLTALPSQLLADQFHYNNLVVGERAMGLGGAFCAVADDASAVVYNPAGIAFALSNDVTGSANAFYRKNIVYKNALANKDFTEKSGGTLAPFFGGMQKMDSVTKGFAVAFGLYTIDSELKDQNDIFTNIGQTVERFHRTANIRATTSGAGLAVAKRFGSQLGVGLSVSYISIDELIQEYQDVLYKSSAYTTQNIRTQLEGSAAEIGLGLQYALGSWTVGLMAKSKTLLSDVWEISIDSRKNNDQNGQVANLEITQSDSEVEEALGELPLEVRLGLAWFPTPEILWTFDTSFHSAAKSQKLGDIWDRKPVQNFATGFEYYATPSIPVRFGAFTNFDARPKLKKGLQGQRDHVDYLGQSLFLGWVQPNSQLSGGLIYQQGRGEAQKVQTPSIQTVEAESFTFALSATHSF